MKYVKEKIKIMVFCHDKTATMRTFLLFPVFSVMMLLGGFLGNGTSKPIQRINKDEFSIYGLVDGSMLSKLPPPEAGTKDTLRIHFLSGCKEYHSEKSLKKLKQTLEQDFKNVKITASWGKDSGKNLPNIERLADADLLVIFTRRMMIPIDQMLYIFRYIGAEKPVIGIRTASHAFQNYLYFDNQIFGGDYQHHGPAERVKVSYAGNAKGHSILKGVSSSWTRPGKLYRNPDLGSQTHTLLTGKGLKSGIREPLAWTNIYGKKGRAFYTSMGEPADFKDKNFMQLLLNAMNWATDQKLYANHRKSEGKSY